MPHDRRLQSPSLPTGMTRPQQVLALWTCVPFVARILTTVLWQELFSDRVERILDRIHSPRRPLPQDAEPGQPADRVERAAFDTGSHEFPTFGFR